MKHQLLAILVYVTAHPLAFASGCEERIVELKAPAMPTSLSAQHTLIRSGSCSIGVSYSLTGEGFAKDVAAEAKEVRCKIFEKAVVLALKESEFSYGEFQSGCEQKFTFELAEDT